MAAPPWSFANPTLDPGIVRREDARHELAERSVLGSLRARLRHFVEQIERRVADARAVS